MNPNSEIPFAESKQERSQKTLDDILQAAERIVEEANLDLFTSRTLAQKSGYALGTLVRRLSSIENVFLWAAKKGRDKKFEEIAIAIVQFDVDVPIEVFAKDMVDKTFSGIQKINPEVMRFFESRYTKMKGLAPDYFSYVDCLVEPYLEASSKNITNTFRQLSKNEATLLLRQLCFLIERPFMEDSPIAGTEEHRKVTQEAIISLLGNLAHVF
jgi:hypothetical protein